MSLNKFTEQAVIKPYLNPYFNSLVVGSSSSFGGSITCTSLLSTGTISCQTNGLTCGAITSSGNFTNGTHSITCGAVTSSGNFTNGTNSMTCGAITSSGNFTNGTNSMTSGAMSCTSLTSTGNVVFPYYSARVYRNAVLNITGGANTPIPFDTLETGGNQNFTISLPQSVFTIPIAGMYLISYSLVTGATAGLGASWLTISTAGVREFAYSAYQSGAGIQNSLSGSITYQFNGSETISLIVLLQNNSTVLGGTPLISTLQIERLHS